MTTVTQQPQVEPKQMNMKVKAVRGLGITQMVIGLLTLIVGIIIIQTTIDGGWVTRNSGSGIWSGLWFIAAGVFGVVSSCHPKNSCWNTTHMVFCVFSTLLSSTTVIFNIVALGYTSCTSPSSVWIDFCMEAMTKVKILFWIQLVLSFADFIVALISAVFCCQANGCCCSSS